jgi:hypothetical protein
MLSIERFREYEDAGVVVKDNYDEEEDLTIKVNETRFIHQYFCSWSLHLFF